MNEQNILIRPFQKSDQVLAHQLILHGLSEHFGFIDETLNPDLDDIAASYLNQGHIFLVATYQQRLVGTGALLIFEQARGQVVRVSTDPAYRRLGIARLLCQQLLACAHRHALHLIIVETNDDWYNAIRLYQGLGFQEYMRQQGSVYMELHLTKE